METPPCICLSTSPPIILSATVTALGEGIMLFSNFSSSPVEKLAERIPFLALRTPTSFIGDAVFKGVQFSILWGLAMWALQWSSADVPFDTAMACSVLVGMATGLWMAVINRRSKQTTGLHRVGYQTSQVH